MNRSLQGLALATGLLGLAATTQAAVWSNKNQWNDQWESRFGAWVSKSFSGDIFLKGKYAGLKHDCADAVYFARLIFAYENALPFVMQDPSSPGRLISNDTTAFDHQPQGQRLRSFMNFIGNQASSNTMMQDTYPVRLDRQWFRPGVVAALPRHYKSGAEQPGHDQIVTRVDNTGVVHYLKSTVPAKVQRLEYTTLSSFIPSSGGGSFRYWKQPQHYGKSDSSLPGYGTDQYRLRNDNEGIYNDELQNKLAVAEEGKNQKLGRLSKEICAQIKQRVPSVAEALQFKNKIGSRCMNYEEFDAYSTPSRDSKIKKALHYLVYTATGSETGRIDQAAKHLNQACGSIQYLPGKQITAAKFAERLLAGMVSSDPNQPAGARWGDQNPVDQGCKQFY